MIKHLKGNIGVCLCDLGFGIDFFDMTPKPYNKNNIHIGLHKIKNL